MQSSLFESAHLVWFTWCSMFFLGTVTGCGTSLRQTMPVPEIPPVEARRSGETVNSYISLEEFEDARPSQVIAEVNGRESSTATSVGLPVRNALAKAMEELGFIISDSAPIVITGKVLEWSAEVKTGLPSMVSSRAKLFIEVLDPANKQIYSGTYEGSTSREEPGITEAEVRQNLGYAMSEAITQIVRDEKLIRLVAAF